MPDVCPRLARDETRRDSHRGATWPMPALARPVGRGVTAGLDTPDEMRTSLAIECGGQHLGVGDEAPAATT